MMVPRPIAGADALRSATVGISPEILDITNSRLVGFSRLRMISENPNTPMATTANIRNLEKPTSG